MNFIEITYKHINSFPNRESGIEVNDPNDLVSRDYNQTES